MNIKDGKFIKDSSQTEKSKNSSKIYFFILAIIALLATNAYYAVRYKNLGKQVEHLNSQKNKLSIEIDRIEAELNRITGSYTDLMTNYNIDYDEAKAIIENLRRKLNDNSVISHTDLLITQQEIKKLKILVEHYNTTLSDLKKQNHNLTQERNKLQTSVNTANKHINQIKKRNSDLTKKIKNASALKISDININAFRIKAKGKESVETKARKVDKFRISFTLADNSLIESRKQNIYLRVTEPSGNLITEGKVFKVNNEEIQYTDINVIEFKNDGKIYTIDWSPNYYTFQKGIYTIILYTKESTMGRSTISLK